MKIEESIQNILNCNGNCLLSECCTCYFSKSHKLDVIENFNISSIINNCKLSNTKYYKNDKEDVPFSTAKLKYAEVYKAKKLINVLKNT